MKPTLYLITITFLFSSCATVWNRRRQQIVFYMQQPGVVIYQKDTVPTLHNKANIRIERKNEIADVQIVEAGIQKSVKLYPHLSTAFWFNLYPSLGLGMLVDMWTPKMWAYPSKIDVTNYDSAKFYHAYQVSHDKGKNPLKSYLAYDPPHNKGELYVHVSLPDINYFSFSPEGEPRKENIGFIGISYGLDYYHSQNQFLSLNIAEIYNSIVPFPAPVDYFGLRQDLRSNFISLSNNYKIKRLSIGYGIAAARNNWHLSYRLGYTDSIPPSERLFADKTHYSFGLIFPVYFQVGKFFHTGLVYRPTFYRPNLPDKFKYEHTMSLDFAWKFRIKK
ncbi:MAG TPA: hypothetical protein VIQ77_00305 [Mucilaginibacter sp.]|jgi:hypothetical protein